MVAAGHYMYMRVYWVQVHKSTFVYRYVDWSIAVPLQMFVFNLFLMAARKPVSSECSCRFSLAWIGFFSGMCGWGYILFEIFKGRPVAFRRVLGGIDGCLQLRAVM